MVEDVLIVRGIELGIERVMGINKKGGGTRSIT